MVSSVSATNATLRHQCPIDAALMRSHPFEMRRPAITSSTSAVRQTAKEPRPTTGGESV